MNEGDQGSGSYPLPNAAMVAAIYARKSNRTEGRSKSLLEQIEFCQEVLEYQGFRTENIRVYCEAEGMKGEYYYEDRAGRHPGPWRPELTRLVNDVEAGAVNAVIVWRSDRLYRDTGVLNALMSVFRKHRIRYICGRWEMDIESAEGIYMATVDAAANRKQRDRASEDIKRDHLWKAKRGMLTGDASCLGFRSAGRGSHRVKPVPEELAIVNRVFGLFVIGENGAGPLSLYGVGTFLMAQGVQVIRGIRGQKRRYPNKVTARRVRYILTNCMYIAKWRHAGQEYDCEKFLIPAADGSGRLETAVPLSLYQAAQEKLRVNSRPGKRSLGHGHLLTGIVVCGFCGCPLFCQTRPKGDKHDANRYRCRRRRPHGLCEPFSMLTVREVVLDAWVLDELAPLLMAQMREIQGSAGREADAHALRELEHKLAEVKEKETKTLASFMGVLDPEQISNIAAEFRRDRGVLERQIADVQAKLRRTETPVQDLSPEAWATMPRAALKQALRQCVEWIAIARDGVLVLTRWGGYISASFRRLVPGASFTKGVWLRIDPPSVAATLDCLYLLPAPTTFVQGRRLFIEGSKRALTDEEILPGFLDLGQGYISEVGPDHSDSKLTPGQETTRWNELALRPLGGANELTTTSSPQTGEPTAALPRKSGTG